MELYINKNQYGYSTTCKDKQNNKCYLDVQFKKNQEPETDKILVIDAFFSCYKNKSNEVKPKLVVMNYSDKGKPFGQAVKPSENKSNSEIVADVMNDPFSDFGNSVDIDDSDLD